MKKEKTIGMVLGKFMPIHQGHVHLISFAQHFVDELYIVVGTLSSEPIDGKLRYEWVKRLFPTVHVLHLDKDLPQEPSEHPDFWNIWRTNLQVILPCQIDYLMASENYGLPLAKELNAQFIPLDIQREAVPISATKIRENPFLYWEYLPVCVRPYFTKKIAIFGPESCGKSTLTMNLAKYYETVFVPEYARTWIEFKGQNLVNEDFLIITKGQLALEKSLIEQANKLLFCDTDVLTTTIWSEKLLGKCDEWILEKAKEQNFDLYILLQPDVPWIKDEVRYFPSERWEFYNDCKETLQKNNCEFIEIGGSWGERFDKAIATIDEMFL